MTQQKNRYFQEIKRSVWRLEEDGKYYSVKRYDDRDTAAKVRKVHARLQAIQFPYIAYMSQKGNDNLVIQDWLTGTRSVDFTKKKDRQYSLQTLTALHETCNWIDWSSAQYLPHFDLTRKWERRLHRFHEQRTLISSFIGHEKVRTIEDYAIQALNNLNELPVDEQTLTLLHGDVVHHNMLMSSDEIVYLIDFDLACLGSANTEISLWLHRVLPHVSYNAELLFDELPILTNLDEHSITMLQYPNELLREWVYAASLTEMHRAQVVRHLLPFTENALLNWPQLIKSSETKLRGKVPKY